MIQRLLILILIILLMPCIIPVVFVFLMAAGLLLGLAYLIDL